ncbi:MAG: hypothetical protein EXR49_03350 [Dehalococcoidia bacterium]|nr:hypothetical protein [Dehalococcoidia bacterium]
MQALMDRTTATAPASSPAQAPLPLPQHRRDLRLTWRAPDAPVTMRTGRLFSLDQRRCLRGVHRRLTGPFPLLTYVAGVMAPSRSSSVASLAHLRGNDAIATIGELDLRQPHPVLRVVAHLRQGDSSPDALLHTLTVGWGCRRILLGGAHLPPGDSLPLAAIAINLTPAERARLTLGLLQAVSAARVSVYAPDDDASAPDADDAGSAFWGEVVRAEALITTPAPHGVHIDTLDYRGYITSLALAVEAAAAVLHPAQGQLPDRIPA